MSRFIQVNRHQQYLLPPSVDEWLPDNHLARFIVEVIDQLDLSRLVSRYRGCGSAAYHPAVLLALLVYGYATGVFSSRKIERATYDSVAFRFLSAETHPDHDTLANFRKTFLVELEDLFVQVLSLAQAMKLVKLGQIALDGTKLKANASKHKALSHGHIEKLEAQLREEVQALLQRAAEADRADEPDGLDLPGELARRENRLRALGAAKAKIVERVAERDARAQQEYEDKVARREAQRQAGKKPRGKEPKPPATGPKDGDQINLTDEESRIMPSHNGFIQGYNSQAAVDVETMLIVAATVTQQTNDKQQVEPLLAEIEKLPEALGKPEALLPTPATSVPTTSRPAATRRSNRSSRWDVTAITCRWRNAWPRRPRNRKPPIRWRRWPGSSKRRKGRPAMPSASPRWSRCSVLSSTSWAFASSPCVDWRRLRANGSWWRWRSI
jgi:transposase